MTENDIAREIVDAAYNIHTKLGPGLLESVYEATLAFELDERSLAYELCRFSTAMSSLKPDIELT